MDTQYKIPLKSVLAKHLLRGICNTAIEYPRAATYMFLTSTADTIEIRIVSKSQEKIDFHSWNLYVQT